MGALHYGATVAFQVARTWVIPENALPDDPLGVFVSTVAWRDGYIETLVVGGGYDGTAHVDNKWEESLDTHMFWVNLLRKEYYVKEAAEGSPSGDGDSLNGETPEQKALSQNSTEGPM